MLRFVYFNIRRLYYQIGSMFTRPLHCPWFDNAFVSFYPRVLVPVEKEFTYFLPWGWSVE